jgi:hypothetical protein
VDGDEIRAEVAGSITKRKHLRVANDIDGTTFDQSTISLVTLTHTFTIESGKNYNVDGTVTNS